MKTVLVVILNHKGRLQHRFLVFCHNHQGDIFLFHLLLLILEFPTSLHAQRCLRLRRCCDVNLFMNDETFHPCICYLRSHYCWSSGMPQRWALYTHLPSFIVKQESSWGGQTWEVDTNAQRLSRLDYMSHKTSYFYILHTTTWQADETLIFKKSILLVFKRRKLVNFHLNIPPPGPHCFMSEELKSPEQLQVSLCFVSV